MAPLHPNNPMALFNDYSKRCMETPNPSLCYPPGVSKNCGPVGIRSIPFLQKHLEIVSLDEKLQDLLHKKVAQHCLKGYKEETLEQHRWKVLCEVASWLQLSDTLHIQQNEWVLDELLTLLLKDLKPKNVKQMPREELEWSRLLSQWMRLHASEDVVGRQIYRLLAVDGFEGFEAKDLRSYLSNILNPKDIRKEYCQHVNAVRSMYDWIELQPDVSSLMGTDSACIVFLALLQLFERKLEELFSDDHIALRAHQARRLAEGFLHRNANYYKDVRKVTEEMLRELGERYEMAWKGKDWSQLGTELMTQLVNKS